MTATIGKLRAALNPVRGKKTPVVVDGIYYEVSKDFYPGFAVVSNGNPDHPDYPSIKSDPRYPSVEALFPFSEEAAIAPFIADFEKENPRLRCHAEQVFIIKTDFEQSPSEEN